jgi:hypothetical protein
MTHDDSGPVTFVDMVLVLLENQFPWLATQSQDAISGADTIDQLIKLHASAATAAHRTGHILAFRTCLKASRYDIVLALRCEATLMHSWRLTDYSCHSERRSSGNSGGVSAGEVTLWNQRFSEKLALCSKQVGSSQPRQPEPFRSPQHRSRRREQGSVFREPRLPMVFLHERQGCIRSSLFLASSRQR